MRFLKHILMWLLLVVLFVTAVFTILASVRDVPETITYGVTFSKLRADELNLDWQETFDALLTDLGVRHLRLVAHWPMVEPTEGEYDFLALDYQMSRAKATGATVILALGRRLPSWPECHVPDWAADLTLEERNQKLVAYMTAVITRYKDSPALAMWQVENEPFIIGYAHQNCGVTDAALLQKEIEVVHALDPVHPVLLTASGELGLWNRTWSLSDVFGTTLYRKVWNKDLNSFITYPTTPAFFRAKRVLTELTAGTTGKKAIIAELAAEPWPIDSIVNTPVSVQLDHMSYVLFEETIDFAARTSFDEQYFWGAEWWYYMKEVHGHAEFWNRVKELFRS